MIIAKVTSTGYILAKDCGCKEGTSVETTEGIHEIFKKLAGMEKSS